MFVPHFRSELVDMAFATKPTAKRSRRAAPAAPPGPSFLDELLAAEKYLATEMSECANQASNNDEKHSSICPTHFCCPHQRVRLAHVPKKATNTCILEAFPMHTGCTFTGARMAPINVHPTCIGQVANVNFRSTLNFLEYWLLP